MTASPHKPDVLDEVRGVTQGRWDDLRARRVLREVLRAPTPGWRRWPAWRLAVPAAILLTTGTVSAALWQGGWRLAPEIRPLEDAHEPVRKSMRTKPRAPALAPSTEPAAATPAVAPEPVVDKDTGRWRKLARAGRYADAHALLDGRWTQLPDLVDDLLLAADAARLSGHPRDAVLPLTRVMRRHSTDARAAIAGFTLGRVYADLGDHRGAARAYESAERLAPNGPLAEAALARAAQSHARAGDRTRARALAEHALARFPAGRLATELRDLAKGP